ncbi:DUF4083 family protein [Sporosarcina psychrophila]|uniref:DUF4083 family protein n=1 Tax=Sporosarcina psychrophila TaxID=1476 RepID=UPI0009EE5962|nr:DUF4083 family protein [Sporosarcina psychrophila]
MMPIEIPTEVIAKNINIVDIIATSIVVLLVILVCVALIVSIRKLSKDQKKKAQNSMNVEQKLDKIITLLEKKEFDK